MKIVSPKVSVPVVFHTCREDSKWCRNNTSAMLSPGVVCTLAPVLYVICIRMMQVGTTLALKHNTAGLSWNFHDKARTYLVALAFSYTVVWCNDMTLTNIQQSTLAALITELLLIVKHNHWMQTKASLLMLHFLLHMSGSPLGEHCTWQSNQMHNRFGWWGVKPELQEMQAVHI